MRKLVAVAVVFAGLIALALATTQLSGVTFGLLSMRLDDPTSILVALMSVLPLLAAVLFGMYLIYNRHHLAARWFADEAGPVVVPSSLMRIGVLLFGLGLVIASLIGTVGTLVTVAQVVATEAQFAAESGGVPLSDSWMYLMRLAGPAVELAVGLILIRRSRRIAAWLWLDPLQESQPSVVLPLCPSCGATYDPADYQPGVTVVACEKCGERLELSRA